MNDTEKQNRENAACVAVRLHRKQSCPGETAANISAVLRLYPMRCSQYAINETVNIIPGSVKLLGTAVKAAPNGLSFGLRRVQLHFFYRVEADSVLQSGRMVHICGLAVCAGQMIPLENPLKGETEKKDAAVWEKAKNLMTEIPVKQIYLRGIYFKWLQVCSIHAESLFDIPPRLLDSFDNDLYFGSEGKHLYVWLQQSVQVRLVRNAHANGNMDFF